MARKSNPESRPITVEELVARASTGSFPRADAPSVRPSAGEGTAASASGMPAYTPPPAAEPAADEPVRVPAIGASGMPAHAPAPAGAAAGEAANVVTGIIPIVIVEDDHALAPAEIRTVVADDLIDADLPAAPASALAAAEEPDRAAIAEPAPAAIDPSVGAAAAAAADEGEDHLATAAELANAQRSAETVAAEPSRAQKRAARKAAKERAKRVRAASAGAAAVDDADAAGEAAAQPAARSAVLGWLALVGEVILGLVIGAGLFAGFTVLWKQYVYFALVLAVLVIFAIVTFAYVLRKRDLATTLLALAVGLIVTIGPLVMLV